MFHRKDSKNPSKIELTAISPKDMTVNSLSSIFKVENYHEMIRSLFINPNILPLTQIKDLLNSIVASQDQIIKNAMKANISTLNKNSEYQQHLAVNWDEHANPKITLEEDAKIFSIKAF